MSPQANMLPESCRLSQHGLRHVFSLPHSQQNRGSNHTQCMDYDFSFSVNVFSCESRNLATPWSPIQAILQNVTGRTHWPLCANLRRAIWT